MLRKKISAVLIAFVVAVGIPASAFADDMASAKVVGGVAESVTSEVNSGVMSEIISTTENQDSAEQNKDTVKNESGNLPDAEEPVLEEPNVEAPKAEAPAIEETAVEPVPEVIPPVEEPMVTEPAIVVEEPVATDAAIVIPEESTLVILHQFETGDIVCQDYETITGLEVGQTIRIGDYNYEDEYEFVECLNEDETAKLVAGENQITLKYALKEGFMITKKEERR